MNKCDLFLRPPQIDVNTKQNQKQIILDDVCLLSIGLAPSSTNLFTASLKANGLYYKYITIIMNDAWYYKCALALPLALALALANVINYDCK
jgi:hypothetical protein